MYINANSFFPDRPFSYVDLNAWYLHYYQDSIVDTKNPWEVQHMVNGLDGSTYGGYAEDRSALWKGTYLDETGGYIHLGIDINVPKNTPVLSPFDADIIDRYLDADDKIGWGGRLLLRNPKRKLLLLAHMEPNTLTLATKVKRGDVLGNVGTWPTNGNTFEHLHVQCVTTTDLKGLDGYGFYRDLLINPNPFYVNF